MDLRTLKLVNYSLAQIYTSYNQAVVGHLLCTIILLGRIARRNFSCGEPLSLAKLL